MESYLNFEFTPDPTPTSLLKKGVMRTSNNKLH